MSQINVTTIRNRTGGAPELDQGIVVGSAATFTGNITGTSATFTGNVSVGGTLTYEDVTNVDSVGIVTAGKGFRATTGGIIVTSGISTLAGTIIAGITTIDASGVNVTGVTTATKFSGPGNIPQNIQAGSYILVASDAGKHIFASGTVEVPNNIFAAGDAVTIVNNTAGDLTITKTITTMYNAADGANNATYTLAGRGMVSILFVAGNEAFISGAGLS